MNGVIVSLRKGEKKHGILMGGYGSYLLLYVLSVF